MKTPASPSIKLARGRTGGTGSADAGGGTFAAKTVAIDQSAGSGLNRSPGIAPFKGKHSKSSFMQIQDDMSEDDYEDEELALTNAKESVVRIFTTHSEPNFALPWTISKQRSSTSTGWILKYNRSNFICTNAHSVNDAAVVEVRRYGDDAKFIANVLCISPDSDLALLEVTDSTFWKDRIDDEKNVITAPQPLKLRKALPRLREEVNVIGFPVGGDNLSVTAGVVSRIDLQDYSMGSLSLLAVQIDAAINPGNSGGPVVDEDMRCVGVAFQTLSGDELQSLGYIIPTEVVIHFLEDYKRHSRYTGFGDPGFDVQLLENPSMRLYYGVGKGGCGVVIKRLEPCAHASKVLKIGDVLMKVDGKKVGFDGTIQLRKGERIPFQYMMTTKFVGDECSLDIIRENKEIKVSMILDRDLSLIPAHPRAPPEYYVIGGLVFVPLTEKFLVNGYGDNWADGAPTELVWTWLRAQRESSDHQVVILTQVLANSLTGGYQDIQTEIVTKFNSKKIKNLQHLVTMVEKSREEYLRFDLSQDDCVIVDREAATKMTPECLRVNMIGADRQLQEPLPPCVPLDTKEKRSLSVGGKIIDETSKDTEQVDNQEGGIAKSKKKRKKRRKNVQSEEDESNVDRAPVVKTKLVASKKASSAGDQTAEDTEGPRKSRRIGSSSSPSGNSLKIPPAARG